MNPACDCFEANLYYLCCGWKAQIMEAEAEDQLDTTKETE